MNEMLGPMNDVLYVATVDGPNAYHDYHGYLNKCKTNGRPCHSVISFKKNHLDVPNVRAFGYRKYAKKKSFPFFWNYKMLLEHKEMIERVRAAGNSVIILVDELCSEVAIYCALLFNNSNTAYEAFQYNVVLGEYEEWHRTFEVVVVEMEAKHKEKLKASATQKERTSRRRNSHDVQVLSVPEPTNMNVPIKFKLFSKVGDEDSGSQQVDRTSLKQQHRLNQSSVKAEEQVASQIQNERKRRDPVNQTISQKTPVQQGALVQQPTQNQPSASMHAKEHQIEVLDVHLRQQKESVAHLLPQALPVVLHNNVNVPVSRINNSEPEQQSSLQQIANHQQPSLQPVVPAGDSNPHTVNIVNNIIAPDQLSQLRSLQQQSTHEFHDHKLQTAQPMFVASAHEQLPQALQHTSLAHQQLPQPHQQLPVSHQQQFVSLDQQHKFVPNVSYHQPRQTQQQLYPNQQQQLSQVQTQLMQVQQQPPGVHQMQFGSHYHQPQVVPNAHLQLPQAHLQLLQTQGQLHPAHHQLPYDQQQVPGAHQHEFPTQDRQLLFVPNAPLQLHQAPLQLSQAERQFPWVQQQLPDHNQQQFVSQDHQLRLVPNAHLQFPQFHMQLPHAQEQQLPQMQHQLHLAQDPRPGTHQPQLAPHADHYQGRTQYIHPPPNILLPNMLPLPPFFHHQNLMPQNSYNNIMVPDGHAVQLAQGQQQNAVRSAQNDAPSTQPGTSSNSDESQSNKEKNQQ